MKNEPNYKHRWWTMCIISIIAVTLFIGTAIDRGIQYQKYEELSNLYSEATQPITDCTWEAWEKRPITDKAKFVDPRERAVAKCVQFTQEQAEAPSACERYRWRVFDNVIESNLDMAEFALDMMGYANGAGQCEAFDGTYWFDNGAWIHEAIRAQEILISWMEIEQ